MPWTEALVRDTAALAVTEPFSAEQAVRIGGVVFRPVLQNLTYYVTVIAARREQPSRQVLSFVDLICGPAARQGRVRERAWRSILISIQFSTFGSQVAAAGKKIISTPNIIPTTTKSGTSRKAFSGLSFATPAAV